MTLKEVFDDKKLRDELIDDLMSLDFLEYSTLDYDSDDEPYLDYHPYDLKQQIDDMLFNNDIIKCDRCNEYHYANNCKLSVNDGYICEDCMEE